MIVPLGRQLCQVLLAHFVGGQKTVLFDPPLAVIQIDETLDRLPYFLEIAVNTPVDDLLFEGSKESFGDAVGLWFTNESETGSDGPVLEP